MNRVLASEPNAAAGSHRSREAFELLELGYHFPAAVCARSGLEGAVLARIGATFDQPGHKAFRVLLKRLGRGCIVNNVTRYKARRAYEDLSRYLHGAERSEDHVTEMVHRADELRCEIATASVRPQH